MDKLHIAIIMDGNGRWATAKNKKRIDGHKVGSEVVRKITTALSKNSLVSDLTLYAFSTENWKRPKMEVDFLMQLLTKYLNNEFETYLENGVKFRAIGDLSRFSSKLQKAILKLEEATKQCSNLTQNLALNYGGKDEVVRAVKKLVKSNQEISEVTIEQYLDISKPVWIEDESSGIGSVFLPFDLREKMKKALVLHIKIPVSEPTNNNPGQTGSSRMTRLISV